MIGHSIHPWEIGAGGVVLVEKDGLSGNPMLSNEVAEGGSNLF